MEAAATGLGRTDSPFCDCLRNAHKRRVRGGGEEGEIGIPDANLMALGSLSPVVVVATFARCKSLWSDSAPSFVVVIVVDITGLM
jgi:hypothetical protein